MQIVAFPQNCKFVKEINANWTAALSGKGEVITVDRVIERYICSHFIRNSLQTVSWSKGPSINQVSSYNFLTRQQRL